jgi:hypothetical protein
MGNNQYLVTAGGNPNYGVELIVAYWLCFLAPIGALRGSWGNGSLE